MARAAQKTSDFKGDHLSIKMFGAIGDGQFITDGAMTSGSSTLQSPSAQFTAELCRPGMLIAVAGAAAGAGTLLTEINGFTDTSNITLGANAGTTVSGVRADWGTDDSDAIDSALTIAAVAAAKGGSPGLYIPSGIYCMSRGCVVTTNVSLKGTGRESSIFSFFAMTGVCVDQKDDDNLTVSGNVRDLGITTPIYENTATGYRLYGARRCHIDIKVYGFHRGMWITGNQIDRYSEDVTIFFADIRYFSLVGLQCEHTTGLHVLHGVCQATTNGNPSHAWGFIFDTGTSGIYIDQWDLEWCGCKIQNTMGSWNPAGYPPQFHYWTRVIGDSCPTQGILLDRSLNPDYTGRAAKSLHFIDCWASGAGFFEPNDGIDGMLIEGGQDISIMGFRARLNRRHGIHIVGGVVIRLINIYSAGNNFQNVTNGAGIFIESTAKKWFIGDSTLTSIVVSGGVAVATTSTAHGLSAGDYMFVLGSDTPTLNLQHPITATTSTTITFTVVDVPNGTYTDINMGINTGEDTGTVDIYGGIQGDFISGDGSGHQQWGIYVDVSFIAPFSIISCMWIGNQSGGLSNNSGTTYQRILGNVDPTTSPAFNNKNRLWFNNGRLEIGDGGFGFSVNEFGAGVVAWFFDNNGILKTTRGSSKLELNLGTNTNVLQFSDSSLTNIVCGATIVINTPTDHFFSLGQPIEFYNWTTTALNTTIPTTRKITAINSPTQFECNNDSGELGTFTETSGKLYVRVGMFSMVSDVELQRLRTNDIAGMNMDASSGYDISTPVLLVRDGVLFQWLTGGGPQILKVNNDGFIGAGKVNLLSADDVSLGTIANGNMLVANSGAIGDGGFAPLIFSGVASGDILKAGTGHTIGAATQDNLIQLIFSHTGAVQTSDINDLDAQLARKWEPGSSVVINTSDIAGLDAALAALASDIAGKANHPHVHGTSAPASHSHSIPTGSTGSAVGSTSVNTSDDF